MLEESELTSAEVWDDQLSLHSVKSKLASSTTSNAQIHTNLIKQKEDDKSSPSSSSNFSKQHQSYLEEFKSDPIMVSLNNQLSSYVTTPRLIPLREEKELSLNFRLEYKISIYHDVTRIVYYILKILFPMFTDNFIQR